MSTTPIEVPEFSLVDSIIENGLTVEASAGSGKTYSVAGAVSLLLATQPELRISEILVTRSTIKLRPRRRCDDVLDGTGTNRAKVVSILDFSSA